MSHFLSMYSVVLASALRHLFIHPFVHSLIHFLRHAHVNSRTLLKQSWKNLISGGSRTSKRRAKTSNIGGSKGRQGRAPPLDPISFIFIQFSGKNSCQIIGISTKNLGNPGSATDQRGAPTYYSTNFFCKKIGPREGWGTSKIYVDQPPLMIIKYTHVLYNMQIS